MYHSKLLAFLTFLKHFVWNILATFSVVYIVYFDVSPQKHVQYTVKFVSNLTFYNGRLLAKRSLFSLRSWFVGTFMELWQMFAKMQQQIQYSNNQKIPFCFAYFCICNFFFTCFWLFLACVVCPPTHKHTPHCKQSANTKSIWNQSLLYVTYWQQRGNHVW